jgi:hypothetical protein
MAGKYDPLTDYLRSIPPHEGVGIDLRVLDRMVRGLPPSSASAEWWANTAGHSQALAWLSVGRRARVDLAAGRVIFSAAGPPVARGARSGIDTRVPAVMNGIKAFDAVLRRAGYRSVAAALAEHTVFLDPKTVDQTGGQPVFMVIRDMMRRGQIGFLADGRRVLLDDNTTPTWAFLWAAGRNKGPDVQYNHVWTDAQNPELYTALWNLCATPAFLAKTTDGQNHPEVRTALQYRAYQLYGAHPLGEIPPPKPQSFDRLHWAPMPDPIADLEATYRARLATSPKSRMAIAAREIGWLFSDWLPDQSLPAPTLVSNESSLDDAAGNSE